MKKLILSTFILAFAVSFSFAQHDFDAQGLLYSDANGNIGIGTASPNKAGYNSQGKVLTVQSTTNAAVIEFSAERTSDNQQTGVFTFANSGVRLVDFAVRAQDGLSSGSFALRTNNGTGGVGGGSAGMTRRFVVTNGGNIGIGTDTPQEKLSVNGQILSEEVKVVNDIDAPDYVFKKDYNLRSISEVEAFINENSHLPEIPSAAEFKEEGVHLGKMSFDLLKKVEELTLYIIELKKDQELLQSKIKKLENK